VTLDPVHFDGIARLARQLGGDVDESDHRAQAETVWAEYLDPLYGDDGDPVLEPVGEQRRVTVPIEDAALQDPPFPTSHGLDSGTINPTTFNNGLVLDVAQAAMAAVPSELELHRGRTIVMTAHTNDPTRDLDDEWRMDDEGYARQRMVQAPRVSRFAEGVVHALALYLAESRHALDNADVVEDLLYLDGPVYPKGLLNWRDRDAELAALLAEADHARDALENYVELVERFLDRGVPLVGFVKNPASKGVTRTLRGRGAPSPWVDDAALYRQVLARHDDDGEVETGALTATGWFRSRVGADRAMAAAGEDLGVDLARDPADYEVTFAVVYDPRDDVVYKVEAPAGVTDDADVREALLRQVLAAVAAERGPPLAVHKADELARISREEKASLRRTLEREFDADRDRTYDDVRWLAVEP